MPPYTKKGGRQIAGELEIPSFKSGMPSFANVLTDAEIWDVLSFIRESWPERERRAQESRNAIQE